MSDAKTDALATAPIGKLLKEYSIPAIIGSTVMIVYNIVDRIYIGNGVGPYAISGLALTMPITALQTAFGTLVGVGASARMSIVLGMQDKAWGERILAHAFGMSIILSVLFIAAIQYFLYDLLVLLGGTDKTIPYAMEYMRIVNAGSIFTTLTYSFGNMMRATGYPRKSMVVMVAGAILNTLLDPVFIFVFELGIRGAAIATVISMVITTVVVVAHYVRPSSYIRFRRQAFRFDPKIVRNITVIGISPFLMNIMMSFIQSLFNNALVAHGGDLAVGAFGIINSLGVLVVMIMMGITQGMQPILGYNYGARNLDRLKHTLSLGIKVGTLVTTAGFACGQLFPAQMVSLFTSDSHLSEIAVGGMRISLLAFPLVGAQIVVATFFQSIGWVKSAITLTLTRQLIFLVPMILILPRFWGLTGVWAAGPVSDTLATITTLIVLSIQRKKLFS